MEPFYFGTSQKPLFGIHHPPEAGTYRDCGVVLCDPMGNEYVQAHRALRQLAVQLARVGFHVLRFDYYGCGDSAGDSDKGDINQWMTDILTAIDEIKDIAGVPKVSLVGLRLGASLSASIGFQRSDVKSMVLWEPIVNGKDYVEELKALHHDWLSRHECGRDTLLISKQAHSNNGDLEILGFPLTNTLVKALENFNLLAAKQCAAKHLFIIESGEKAGALCLRNHLTKLGIPLDYENIPGPQVWIKKDGRDKMLVPGQILQSIVSWISRDCL